MSTIKQERLKLKKKRPVDLLHKLSNKHKLKLVNCYQIKYIYHCDILIVNYRVDYIDVCK